MISFIYNINVFRTAVSVERDMYTKKIILVGRLSKTNFERKIVHVKTLGL